MQGYRLAIVIVVLMAVFSTDTIAADTSPESAANAFLDLIDGEDYDMSWKSASAWLKDNVTAEEWEKHAGQYRRPLGVIENRETASVEFEDNLEGMPEGRYAFVTYDTSLEDGGKVVELVGLRLGDDDVWRVIGYQAH